MAQVKQEREVKWGGLQDCLFHLRPLTGAFTPIGKGAPHRRAAEVGRGLTPLRHLESEMPGVT